MSYSAKLVLLTLMILALGLPANAGNISPGVNDTAQTQSSGGPNIIGFGPNTPASSTVGNAQIFNITIDQVANITWYINDTYVNGTYENSTDIDKNESRYVNNSVDIGTWIVNVTAENDNGTISKRWTWTVLLPLPLPCGGSGGGGEKINSNVEQSVTFNMTVNKSSNISWYVNNNLTEIFNNTAIFNETNVTISLYNTSKGIEGKWYVAAVATLYGTCDSTAKIWIWTVSSSQPSPPGGDGGGGGGGGGGGTDEPYENIFKSESREKSILANITVTYNFTTPELAIYQVIVTGKESENDVNVRIETLKNTSKLVTGSAPGIVYKNENVLLKSQRIEKITLKFRVNNSWINDNDIADSNIDLFKWNASKWIPLETKMTGKDGTYTYFESDINSGSRFAISATKGEGSTGTFPFPSSTGTGKPTATKIPIPAISKQSPGFDVTLLTLIIFAIFILRRKIL